MSKNKRVNQVDNLVTAFSTEFAKIPDFNKVMADPDLKRVHTFVAVSLTGLYATRDLVVNSFVPAINKSIVQTKLQIGSSAYKEVLKTLTYDIEDIRYETVRMGYVYTFHKYENLVKSYIKLMEELSLETTQETNETLEKFMDKRFSFKPTQWYKFPKIHKVQFVANCTKHADGLCKPDNSKHIVPSVFSEMSENETIKPTVKEFKEDITALIDSVKTLLSIVSHANIIRTIENNIGAMFKFQDEQEVSLHDEETQKIMELRARVYEQKVKTDLLTYQLT